MKSLSEFQESRLSKGLLAQTKGGNQPLESGGMDDGTPTGPSPAGGVCLYGIGCQTWTSDIRYSDGSRIYYGGSIIGAC